MNIVEVQNVTKSFSNHVALKNLSLSIPQGVVFGLLGPNGAGKTTLIRMLNQITAPDSGTILYKGHPLSRSDIETVGYLPEERGLYKKMKVSDQAIYLAQLKGLSKDEAVKRLHYWFQKFDIESWWNKKVSDLSKGMQQKVQFIITIIHNPDFLIFDEPFSGFDPINTELLKSEILELKKNGATIILSTHNMNSVEEICDDIVLLNNGENVLSGHLFDIKKQFSSHCFDVTIPSEFAIENLPDSFTLLSKSDINNETKYSIKISESVSSNDLLKWFIERVQVLDFHEIIPSMNDIFIQTITAQNLNTK